MALQNPDKILIYNIKHGWEPICKFIGEDIPNIPFPFLNKGASMINRMVNDDMNRRVNRETTISLALITSGIVLAGYLLLSDTSKSKIISEVQRSVDFIFKNWW